MVSKVGRGSQVHLVCSDCALRLSATEIPATQSRPRQLGTLLLLLLFVLTAGGVMLLSELHSPSLLQENEGMNLNEARSPKNSESKRWIVVPRLPAR